MKQTTTPPLTSRAWASLLAPTLVALAAVLAQTAWAQTAAPAAPSAPAMGGPRGDGPPPGPRMAARMGAEGRDGMGWGGEGHGRGHGMRGEHGMGMAHYARMLDAAKATPEQRQQIRSIFAAAQQDMQAQRAGGRELRQQMQAALAAPTVDAAAIEKLRQQMQARHEAGSKRMTQAMVDAAKVLTPEQRKALAEQRQQRRAMAERHAAERAALDGRPAPAAPPAR